ncbi:MAG TPA: toprim domain-containing protein [Candidatus Acidoferrales bacterium]|nr:toprim domain-containing protein [Candidatus Acidoferrales bacterium]
MTTYRPAREGRRARKEAQVREVEDLKLAAAEHGFRGPTQDGNWATCCPFCERRVGRVDREFKLTIKISGSTTPSPGAETGIPLSPEFGVWHCYRCHARGFADFRWMLEDLPAPDPAAPPLKPEKVDLGPPEGFVTIAECERSVTMRWVSAYFESRGVFEQARAAGAGGCQGGKFGGRVVVPYVEEVGGPWLGFSARLVAPSDRRPKYLYPRGMDRRRALWGLPHLPQDERPVWLVEGVFDAIPLFPRALALFGKGVSEGQLDRLAALWPRSIRPFVACLDGDARDENRALAMRLRLRGATVLVCELPPDRDPGTLGWRVRDYLVREGA